jgi:hypothetical protein
MIQATFLSIGERSFIEKLQKNHYEDKTKLDPTSIVGNPFTTLYFFVTYKKVQ